MQSSENSRPTLLDRLRLSTVVHHFAVRAMDAYGHAPLMADVDGVNGIRTLIVGVDPIRLLIFGGGLAVGYGVTTRDEAFDGPLARIVAERTGRGVIVENRAVQHLGVDDAVASLGATGAHTFSAAVWCPSFADGTRRPSLRSWRVGLDAMVRQLRSESDIPLLLTGLPVPIGSHPVALIGRPFALRLNRVIAQVAARHDHVVSVDTEPFLVGEIGSPPASSTYFPDVAARLAPALLGLLGVPMRPAHRAEASSARA